MADEIEESLPGYCPTRLSTDEPVAGFAPRAYVATGRSVSSDEPNPRNPAIALPEMQVDPRAAADTGPVRSIAPAPCVPPTTADRSPAPAVAAPELPAIRAATEPSDPVLDLLRHTCRLLEKDSQLSATDIAILHGADAILEHLHQEVQERLRPPKSKGAARAKPAPRSTTKRGTRSAKK